MTSKLLLAAVMLIAVPCAFSQDASAPPTPPPAQGKGMMKHGPGGYHEARGFEGRGGPGAGGPGGGGMRGGGLPPGTWWRNPDVITRLTLTADQQKRIDETFLQSRVQLIDLHASLEKQQLMLEPLLNANPVDQGKALAQISKIADTRADLEKADAKMLLSIRAVLTADQWTKLRERRGMPGGMRGGPARDGAKMHGGPGGPAGPGHDDGPMQ